MNNKCLVIAAHPDDEILGAGGMIKKLSRDGAEVVSVILAKGRPEAADRIQHCIATANERLGVKETLHLQFPNLEMETIPLHVISKELEKLIASFAPTIMLTHHYGDVNHDHQIAFQAALTATRPLPGAPPIDLLCFETVSSTEWGIPSGDRMFKPNYYVDISDTLDDKIDALHAYDIEMRAFPHPRSYEGVKYLGRLRGMTAGFPCAEAFEIIRMYRK